MFKKLAKESPCFLNRKNNIKFIIGTTVVSIATLGTTVWIFDSPLWRILVCLAVIGSIIAFFVLWKFRRFLLNLQKQLIVLTKLSHSRYKRLEKRLQTIMDSKMVFHYLEQLPQKDLREIIQKILPKLPTQERLTLKDLEVVVRLDYEPHDIYLSMRSATEYPRHKACHKEPMTVQWIEQYVKPQDVLYDIGANVGAYSFVAAKHTGGQAKIFAFEPAFFNYASLCQNIVLNKCQTHVIALPLAVGDKTRLEYFNYADLSPGSALHTLGEEMDYRGQRFNPVYRPQLLAYRIDDLIEVLHFPVPNHIKIDVDGTEVNVLQGAEKTLAHSAMVSMMIEICELRVPAARISEFLGPMGWSLVARYERSSDVTYLQFGKKA